MNLSPRDRFYLALHLLLAGAVVLAAASVARGAP